MNMYIYNIYVYAYIYTNDRNIDGMANSWDETAGEIAVRANSTYSNNVQNNYYQEDRNSYGNNYDNNQIR
jgi:hypothetical protein